MKDNKLTISRPILWTVGTIILSILFVIYLVTGGFGLGKDNASGIPIKVNANNFTDDDPILGDKNAKLTIVEFSDYQCPSCEKFWSKILPQLKLQYINTGKVKLVYRDLPLESIHPNARSAAEAANCAGEQSKYFEFHDKLFENQQEWASVGIPSFNKYAQEIGLDVNKFSDCINSKKYKDEITNDLRDAASVGARGTPYFIIGNQTVVGAQPFSNFQAIIESQL